MRFITFIFMSVFFLSAFAKPSAVFMIRHGEKPPDGPDLSEAGWARARALPEIFSRPEFAAYGAPACVVGMAAKKYDGSVRALQTLKYVSEKFNVPLTGAYNKDQSQSMVNFVMNSPQCDGHLVVIAWEHNGLEDIAFLFGVRPKPNWPGGAYDRIWFLQPTEAGVSFTDLPQRLMPGDTDQ